MGTSLEVINIKTLNYPLPIMYAVYTEQNFVNLVVYSTACVYLGYR